MKFIQAHNYDNPNTKNMDFFVNSCGYYSKLERGANTNRPDGRSDYQLIYVTEGKLYIERESKLSCLMPGEAVLFYPGEPQRYYANPKDCTSFYWIHFGGKATEAILKANGFWGKKHIYAPINKEDIRIIYRMTEEINRKHTGYTIQLASLFCQLCVDIARRSSGDAKSIDGYCQLSNAIRSMEHDPGAKYTIDDYAHMCGMSRYHFMHMFKQTTGKSPIQYRNELRIVRGASLLIHTDMSVRNVSEYVGFDDSLYFSRCFCRHFGLPPTEYRKKNNDIV